MAVNRLTIKNVPGRIQSPRPRFETQSGPPDDDCRHRDSGGEVEGEFIVPRGDAAKILESTLSSTSRTARSQISEENLCVVLPVMAPPSQELEPPTNPGRFTATSIGTPVEEGKQVLEIDGKRYQVEKPIHGDFALIAAQQADYAGNLLYSLTAHNFNPIMALAGRAVIVEPEMIVPIGVIPPDAVKTPGVLVDHMLARAA